MSNNSTTIISDFHEDRWTIRNVKFVEENPKKMAEEVEIEILADRLDKDEKHMSSYEDWIRGRCVYECAICNTRFYDR